MTNTREVTNEMDTIDSREIQERIDYLESLAKDIDEDEKEELHKLQEFKDEADASEWDYGVAFINEEYFEDYARELAVDIGAISNDVQWPATCIDWADAADDLKIDYSQAEFDGVTYYFR